MKTYLSKDWSQNTFVNTANSVWMNKDTSWSADIEKDFLTPAKDYYSGEVYEADFNGQPDKVVQNVNNWVSTNTNKMIPEILKEIPGGTVMMLINAVYFEENGILLLPRIKLFRAASTEPTRKALLI